MPQQFPKAVAITGPNERGLMWHWMTGLLIFGAALATSAATVRAESHETIITSHGISTFGNLKYGPDMVHLDYVNPDAPKGGEASVFGLGTFDSMNPYTRKGRAGSLSTVFFEEMLTGTADEIGSAYCYLCSTMEYPESREWVIFNIRDEVRFSDGTDLTADDVKYTYDIFLSDGLPSFRAVLPQTIDSVEVLGPKSIKFTFNPESPIRDRIQTAGGLPVFSKKWFEDTGAGLDESRLEPAIGSGPYVLDSYDVNQRIVYKRNPDFWGNDLAWNVGRHNFDTIRVEYYGDSVAAFEGFKAGNYTFRNENSSKSWATSYDFPKIESGVIRAQELANGNIGTGQSYAINMRQPQFQDIRVREAISLMFNFEWSNEALFFGLYERIESFWENTEMAASGVPTPGEVAVLKPLVDQGLLDPSILTDDVVMAPTSGDRQLDRRNLRKASKLLDDAGWLVGEDGVRRKDGQTLKLEIIEDSAAFDRIHQPFVQNLKALGIDATYERIDFAQYTNRTRANDFDLITDQFPMSYEPGSGLLQYFGSKSADDSVFNSPGVKSPAVDALIEIIMAAETREKLTDSVRAMDRVLRSMKFWVPQWYKDVHTVAYYDFYRYPDPLPPYALGQLDFWWADTEAYDSLKSQGAF